VTAGPSPISGPHGPSTTGTGRTTSKPGDLVVWGGGSHIGIYIGHGKAISTLTRGVRVHGVHAVTARFTAYLHTGMWKRAAH
jgi:cell wall-associated NlpC family hydrolase